MNRALRRQHLTMVAVLALVTLVVLALAIGSRRHVPPSAVPQALVRNRTP
jgi:hypothetical protein